jgi:hypothetical protein
MSINRYFSPTDNYDINSAKCEIFKSLNSIPKLYEDIDKLKLYNCHIILRYPESVRNLGPLRYHSAYYSENQMEYFRSLVKSFKNIPQQIVSKYTLKCNNYLQLVDKNLISKM